MKINTNKKVDDLPQGVPAPVTGNQFLKQNEDKFLIGSNIKANSNHAQFFVLLSSQAKRERNQSKDKDKAKTTPIDGIARDR